MPRTVAGDHTSFGRVYGLCAWCVLEDLDEAWAVGTEERVVWTKFQRAVFFGLEVGFVGLVAAVVAVVGLVEVATNVRAGLCPTRLFQ